MRALLCSAELHRHSTQGGSPHGVQQSSDTNNLRCQTYPKATFDDQELFGKLSNLRARLEPLRPWMRPTRHPTSASTTPPISGPRDCAVIKSPRGRDEQIVHRGNFVSLAAMSSAELAVGSLNVILQRLVADSRGYVPSYGNAMTYVRQNFKE